MTAYRQVWQEMMRLGKTRVESLLSTFLSTRCAVCDRLASQVFCVDCLRQVEAEYSPFDTQINNAEGLDITQGKFAIGSLGVYQGTLKQAILSLKYKNCPAVAHILGAELARRWQPQLSQQSRSLYVVPIPLHPNRLAQRGYNQAALIARSFSQISGFCLAENALLRCTDTTPQHQLGAKARQENLTSAFEVSIAWKRKLLKSQSRPDVLLIDDIYTTGATAQSAVMALKVAGIPAVGFFVLARAESGGSDLL